MIGLRDRLLLGCHRTPDGCWVWGAGKSRSRSDDYGIVSVGGRCRSAHRVSYEVFVGPIPSGLTIDHLCRNTLCINPAHLEAVTTRENILRGHGMAAINIAKTRCPKGHPMSGSNLEERRQRNGSIDRRCAACRRAEYATPEYRARQREKRARAAERVGKQYIARPWRWTDPNGLVDGDRCGHV